MGENPPAADDRGSRETAQASESQQTSGCSGNDLPRSRREEGGALLETYPLFRFQKLGFDSD